MPRDLVQSFYVGKTEQTYERPANSPFSGPWCARAIQIRTFYALLHGLLGVVEGDRLRAVPVVEDQHQLVVVN